MKIGIAGMATLQLLRGLDQRAALPVGYDNPTMSAFINALWDAGHEVVVYSTSLSIDRPVVFHGDRMTVCLAARQQRAARRFFKSERQQLVHLMQEHPADIINAHWSYEFAWAALDTGLPTLVTVRDRAWTVLRYSKDVYRLIRVIMNSYVLRRARYLSVNSRYLFEALPREVQKKTRVIENFFAHEALAYCAPYSARGDVIVSVANSFSKLKNIGNGIRAFGLLRQRMPNLEYRIIGDGMAPGQGAEGFAREAGLCAGVSFVGRLEYDRVLQEIAKAKLLLHPSREESFGMSVLEAMVVGTPVVGGERSGNVPALLKHGEAGVLCNIADPVDIFRAASTVLLDAGEAERLASVARSHALHAFSREAVVSAYLDYYDEIVRGGASVADGTR